MILEVITRIHLLFPVREVRVLPIQFGASPWKVLRDRGHALVTIPSRSRSTLKAFEASRHQVRDQIGILAKGRLDPGPPVLRRHISLRVQCHPQAHGQVLLPDDIGEPARQVRAAEGGEAERLWPLTQRARPGACAHVGVEVAPRVGGQRDWDAEPGVVEDVLLELVVPPGHELRVRDGAEEVEV